MKIKDLIESIQILNEFGRIIPGSNTPAGITKNHTKLIAKRLGFNVNKDGYAPVMPTNGKINNAPPKEKDHTADDKKSMFGGADLTPLTNGKTRDIAESVETPSIKIKKTNESEYYHGSDAADAILQHGFQYQYIGKGNDLYGYGFYFINNKELAKSYATKTGKAVSVTLDIKKPIVVDASKGNEGTQYPKLSIKQVEQIIAGSPDINSEFSTLSDYADLSQTPIKKAISIAAPNYVEGGFFSLMNDFYRDHPKEFLENYHKATGYDGVKVKSSDQTGEITVAWFPSQIKQMKKVSEAWERIQGDKTHFKPGNHDIDIQYGVVGHSHGQTDGYVAAYDTTTKMEWKDPIHGEGNHKCVGLLNWSEYEGKPLVKMIQVLPEYKKQGIARALLSRLQKEFPEAELDFGWTTGKGQALKENKSAPLYHATSIGNARKIRLKSQLE
jgi:GNAT superfamily N-acetyltransferase